MGLFFRQLLCVYMLFWAVATTSAQNHVPNGDFEAHTLAPTSVSQIYYLLGGWSQANGCVPGNPGCGTPDYLHTDGFNFGPAASGKGYMGVFTSYTVSTSAFNYREYITIEMDPWLDTTEVYLVSFWVKPHKIYPHTTYSNNLGVVFSKNFPTQSGSEPIRGFEPQLNIDEVIEDNDWVRYRFLLYADSIYRSITLGNFYADTNTIVTPGGGPNNTSAYYLIDSVRVEWFNYDLQANGDTTVCPGEPVVLSASGDIDYQWATTLAPDMIIDTASVITVRPDTTTTYLLYGTFDTTSIEVTVLPAPVFELGADTSICSGDSIYLYIKYPNYPVVWHDGDTTHQRYVSHSDTYSATLLANNGCSFVDEISLAVINCDTIIDNISEQGMEHLRVYPNPSYNNGWYIDGLTGVSTKLWLYNSQGKVVYKAALNEHTNYPYHIHQQTEPGVYLLRIWVGEKSVTRKLILY